MTFVLVHGAWHGAWCWERVGEALDDRGHSSVAVDLPADDPDAGLARYAEAIAHDAKGVDGEVVVVAHSMTGLVAPLVADLRPVASIVYLAAFIPLAGASMADQFADATLPILLLEGGRETDALGRSQWTDAETTRRLLYPDLSDADARWAFERLRPQAATPQREPHPGGLPDVRATSLICSDDRLLNPEWSRLVARDRLATDPIELAAGHFPMFTAPDALAEALVEAAS